AGGPASGGGGAAAAPASSSCAATPRAKATSRRTSATARIMQPYLIIAVATLAAAGACSRRDRRTPDDTLVYIFESRVRELDPRYVVGSNDTKVSRLITSALVSIDQPSLAPMMEMAESVVAEDPLTWVVTLREGVRFSDGSPMTSADVVHTFRSVLDPKRGASPYRMYHDRIASLEAIDARRVRFHLVAPFATFVTDMEMGILCAACDARGELVGAAPYRLVSFDEGEIVLERNPYWFRGAPPMRRIIF